MKAISIDQIQSILEKKEYAFFDSSDFDLNCVYMRSSESKSDKFDDIALIVYRLGKELKLFSAPVTTDPGKHWLLNPMNKKGTIITVPQQTRKAHMMGKHRGYKALQQVQPMTYVRDNTKDSKLDFSLIEDERNHFDAIRGTNIHRASQWKRTFNIGKYSAGCTVFQDPTEFKQFLALCDQQIRFLGSKYFTFTLIEEKDIL